MIDEKLVTKEVHEALTSLASAIDAAVYDSYRDSLRKQFEKLEMKIAGALEDARYGGLRDQCAAEKKQLERASAAAAGFVPHGKNDVVRAYYAGVAAGFNAAANAATVGTQQIAVPYPPDEVRVMVARMPVVMSSEEVEAFMRKIQQDVTKEQHHDGR